MPGPANVLIWELGIMIATGLAVTATVASLIRVLIQGTTAWFLIQPLVNVPGKAAEGSRLCTCAPAIQWSDSDAVPGFWLQFGPALPVFTVCRIIQKMEDISVFLTQSFKSTNLWKMFLYIWEADRQRGSESKRECAPLCWCVRVCLDWLWLGPTQVLVCLH